MSRVIALAQFIPHSRGHEVCIHRTNRTLARFHREDRLAALGTPAGHQLTLAIRGRLDHVVHFRPTTAIVFRVIVVDDPNRAAVTIVVSHIIKQMADESYHLLFDQLDRLEMSEDHENDRWRDLMESIKSPSHFADEIAALADDPVAFTLSSKASQEDVARISNTQYRLKAIALRLREDGVVGLSRLRAAAQAQKSLRANMHPFIMLASDVISSRPVGTNMLAPGELPRIDLSNRALDDNDIYDEAEGALEEEEAEADDEDDAPRGRRKKRTKKKKKTTKPVDISHLGFIDPTQNIQLSSF